MRYGWVAGVAVLVVVGLSACGVGPVPAGNPPTPGVTVSPSGVETVAPVTAKPRIAQVLVDEPDMVYQRPEQVLLAPSTFTVDGDRVVVSDTVNWVFAVYRGSKRVASIPRPPASSTIDLVIRGDLWYLLSRDNEVLVYRLAPGGKRLAHQKTLKFAPSQGTSTDGDRVQHFGVDGGNLFVVSRDGACMPIEGACPSVEVSSEDRSDRSFLVRDGSVQALIELNQLVGTYDCFKTTGVGLYCDVMGMGEGRANKHRYLYQFGADGRLAHTYTLPMAEDDLPKRDLVVADGKVYLMLNTTKTAKILLIAPNP